MFKRTQAKKKEKARGIKKGKKNISGIYGNTSGSHFLQGCLMTGCLNDGSCVFNEEKETFACACKVPWSGEKCELGKTVVLLLAAFLL